MRAYRAKEKIILYTDNVSFHHSKKINNFVSFHPKLEVRYLPAYSPDMNPVKRVWWYMRKKITHNRYLETIKERMGKFWKLFSQCLKPNELIKKICVIL